jgi:transcriptional regulator with XRE-family HTH domain
MTKAEIAKSLKSYRQKANLTGTEVMAKLKSKGIVYTVKAIYNWETGRSQPDCNTFMALCGIYGIENIMSAFGYENEEAVGARPRTYKDELLDKIVLLDEINCKIVSAYIDGLLTDKRGKWF